MKVVEIRNNLVKVEFKSEDGLVLGRFLVLASAQKSYVAQIINIKIGEMQQHAIVKLMFTFTNDGVVDNYDGSIPDMESEITMLSAQELLDLLPVETPIKFGHLAQQDNILKLDISIFEHNLSVFSDHDFEKFTFISNCLHQLSDMNEKSVVIDDSNIFENTKKILPGRDFKLPLNSDMIDYIFDYELSDVNLDSKAVIKDIFSEIEKYVSTLEEKFLPIDKFVDVVTAQYQQNKMGELAMLRSKLLKYKDAGLFANSKDEIDVFEQLLEQNDSIVVDIKDFEPSLQNRIINIVHDQLNSINSYIYLFASLHDDNSDKALIRKFINHNHVFTTLFVSHSYKYAAELKEHAENVVFYTPQTIQHEFAAYNTFLNKLNHDEFVIYGKLTQGIPFIVESEIVGSVVDIEEQEPQQPQEILPSVSEPEEYSQNGYEEEYEEYPQFEGDNKKVIEPIENLMADDNTDTPEPETEIEEVRQTEVMEEPEVTEENETEEVPEIKEIVENPEEVDISEELPEGEEYFENPNISEITSELQEPIDEIVEVDELSNEDLDFLDEAMPSAAQDSQGEEIAQIPDEEEFYEAEDNSQQSTPIVPVYPADGVDLNAEPDDIGVLEGDTVSHPRYGKGIVQKIIKYGNKTLCSIAFENVGRRLLDPSISSFTKL